MDEMNWLTADYFDDFRCKCGECRHTCCGGWRIAVSEKEYFRIIGMDCSEKLHEKIEGAFVRPDFPTSDRYMLMEADWTGRCRMLDSDGMCMLQKECGEESITEVCRVYPRSYKSENGILNACCSASCEAVVELLLRNAPLKFNFESQTQLSSGKDVHPEISEKVQFDLNSKFNYVIKILQDRTISLKKRIGLISSGTGLDLKNRGIAEAVRTKGLYDTIFPIISEFSEEAPSFSDYVSEFENRYSKDNFAEKFSADSGAFEEHFPDWSCYFENLLCNNMLYSSFPAVDSRVDPEYAVLGLSLEYTLLRVMCICHTAEKSWTKESLVDVIAEVYHIVEHTSFYYNAVVLLGKDLR